MKLRPRSSTRNDTLFPSTTLFRSLQPALRNERVLHLSAFGCGLRADLADRGLDVLRLDRCGHVIGCDAEHRHPRRIHPDAHRILRCASDRRSEEHTSELQSLMRTSYAVFCLKKKTQTNS